MSYNCLQIITIVCYFTHICLQKEMTSIWHNQTNFTCGKNKSQISSHCLTLKGKNWNITQEEDLIPIIKSKVSKVSDHSRGWPEGSLFDSYYTKV